MRNLFVLFLLFWGHANAQVGRTYVLTGATNLQGCSDAGAIGSFPIATAPGGAKFSIVGTTTDNYIVRFWQWTYNAAQLASYKANVNAARRNPQTLTNLESSAKYYAELNVDLSNTPVKARFFLLKKGDLDLFAVALVNRWSPTFGAVVLPFKARPQGDFDFTKDLSISGMGGVRLSEETGKFSVAFLLGVGLASVTLDSQNSSLTSAEDRAAITLPIGVVGQWNRLQLGVFAGWDFLSKRNESNWTYQHLPWVTLGIGFAIFSEQNAPQKEGSND